MNDRIDDIARQSAARLRISVDALVEQQPARRMRRSAAGPRLAVTIAILTLAASFVGTQGPEERVDVGNSSVKSMDRTVRTGDPQPTAHGAPGAVSGPDAETPISPAGAEPSTGDAAEPGSPPAAPAAPKLGRDAQFEPSSEESSWPDTATCATRAVGEPTPEWCGSGDTDGWGTGGHPIKATLCRDAQAGGGVLNFPSRLEADFVVFAADGREVWRWSKTRELSGPAHRKDVRAGSCLTWGIQWNEIDQAGRPVPPGTYTSKVAVLADEMNGQWWQSNNDLICCYSPR